MPDDRRAHDAPAELVQLLRAWCVVLSVGLLVAVGLATYGFAKSSSATSAARAAGKHLAGTAQLAAETAERVASDELATCKIQARGLQATHVQTAINANLYTLLTLKPTTHAERLAAAQTPPRVRRLVRRLAGHLRKYRRLEAKQPPTRKCG